VRYTSKALESLKDDFMKVSLIVFSALFAISGTAYAERFDSSKTGSAVDARKAVPGIGDAIYSPKNIQGSGQGWGTGKGDTKRKMEIGETEKNLRKRPPSAAPINLPKPPENPATPPGVPIPYPNTDTPRPIPAMK
jgi:hypothetical protein